MLVASAARSRSRILRGLPILAALLLALCLAPQSAQAEPDPAAGETVASTTHYYFPYKNLGTSVEVGTPLDSAGVPGSIGVLKLKANGDIEYDSAAVVWSGDYDPNTPGIYTLTSSFANPDLQFSPDATPLDVAMPTFTIDVLDPVSPFGGYTVVDIPLTGAEDLSIRTTTLSVDQGMFSKGVAYHIQSEITHPCSFQFKGVSFASYYYWTTDLEIVLYDSHGTELGSMTVTPGGFNEYLTCRLVQGLNYYYVIRSTNPLYDDYNLTIDAILYSNAEHTPATAEQAGFDADSYPQVVKAPDCNAGDAATYVCSDCGATYTTYDYSNVGHEFGSDGVCTKCGLASDADEVVLGQTRPVYVKRNNANPEPLQFTPEYTHNYLIAPYIYVPSGSNLARPKLYLDVQVFEVTGSDSRLLSYGHNNIMYGLLLEAGKTYQIYVIDKDNYYQSARIEYNVDFTITPASQNYGVHAHAAGAEPTSTTAPVDCSTPGSETYTCAVCGVSYNEYIPGNHVFADGVCTLCGAHEGDDEQSILLNQRRTIVVEPAQNYLDAYTLLKFVPPATHSYKFTSYMPKSQIVLDGPYGAIFDSEGNEITTSSSIDATNRNFCCRAVLEEGKTYYLGARFNMWHQGGTYPVDVTYEYESWKTHTYPGTGTVTYQPTCSSQGTEAYTCSACGVQASRTLPKTSHVFGPNGTCTACGQALQWNTPAGTDYWAPYEIWTDDGEGHVEPASSGFTSQIFNIESVISKNADGSDGEPFINSSGFGYREPRSVNWRPNTGYSDTVICELNYVSDEYDPIKYSLQIDPETQDITLTDLGHTQSKAELINVAVCDPETGKYDNVDGNGFPRFGVKLTFAKAAAPEKPAQLETVDSTALGFAVNLFDYDTSAESSASTSYVMRGIDKLSPLKFYGEVQSEISAGGNSNTVMPDRLSLQGVVLPELGSDGFPVTTEFGNQSLDVLFGTQAIDGVKDVYTDANHLFVKGDDGMLTFDSSTNFAYYDPSQGNSGDFKVYGGTYLLRPYVDYYSREWPEKDLVAGYLPFDDYNPLRTTTAVASQLIGSGVKAYNRSNGLTMTWKFTMPEGLTTDSGQDYVFTYSGDDDAWLFVDGVLVLDMGGMGGDGTGTVDFTLGKIAIDEAIDLVPGQFEMGEIPTVPKTLGATATLEQAFANVGKTWDPTAEHEFKFFSINRVSVNPHMAISTNLYAEPNPTVDVPVVKRWVDGAEAHAGQTVTVQLVADGVDVEGKTLVLSAENGWEGVFEGLPKLAADGVTPIAYTVREAAVDGWHATYESGGQLVRERTYWVPIDPSELTDGGVYAIIAAVGDDSSIATDVGEYVFIAGTGAMIHDDGKAIDGTTYPTYFTSMADSQQWTAKKHNSGSWIFSHDGKYLSLSGRDYSIGGTSERIYSYVSSPTNGWNGDLGINLQNRLDVVQEGDKTYLTSKMNWGNGTYSPVEYLTLSSQTAGMRMNAVDHVEWATPVTFYTPVTVDEPYEPAGLWTVTNSDRFGDLVVRVRVSGDGQVAAPVTVTLDDPAVEGAFGDMTFAGGVATLSVQGGQTATAAGLPAGALYRVEGGHVDGYQSLVVPEGVVLAGDAMEAELLYAPGDTPAEAVENLIDALPDADKVTAGDKDAIEDALEAYGALTDEERAQVSQDAKDKLAADEAALDKLLNTPVIERIWGDYANETSAKISAKAFEASEWVVLARDDDFADALGAVGVAGALDAPIVLTDRTSLSPAAAAEIQRLGATKCWIIGGTGAMKAQLEADLAAIGVTQVDRLWGENSYDTSLACAKEIVALGGKSDEAVIAMSLNFQDALSISPYAYKYKVPVVLQTWGDTSADRGFTPEAAEWLTGRSVLVAGGAGAISDASIAPYELVDRLWGESGYDTSGKIAEWMTSKGYLGTDAVVFACGAQAPRGTDALAGAALAGRLSAPILLATSNEAMEPADLTTVEGFYAANADKVRHTYVLGGAYVMPDALYAQIQAMNNAEDVSD